MHPYRWHILTWTVFLFWLLFALPINIPFQVHPQWLLGIPDEISIDSETGRTFSSTEMIGWPIPYQYRTVTSPYGIVTTSTNWIWLLFNIATVTLIQLSIVYSLQQKRRLSVKTFMTATLLIALMISIGRVISNTYPEYGILFYVLFIYFSPMPIAISITIYKWFMQHRFGTEHDITPNS